MPDPNALFELAARYTGEESEIAPKTWFAPQRQEWAGSFVSGIEAVQEYHKLGQDLKKKGEKYAAETSQYLSKGDKYLAAFGGEIPNWMAKAAEQGALWTPMLLELRSLNATVEVVTGRAFDTVSKKVKEAAKYASFVQSGVDLGIDIIKLVNSEKLNAANIVGAVNDLLNGSIKVVVEASKAFKFSTEAVKDVFAAVPWVGKLTSVVLSVIEFLIKRFAGTDPRMVLANIKIADMQAREVVFELCKSKLSQSMTPLASEGSGASQTPGDYFRPISYWIQRSVDHWVGAGEYSGKTPGKDRWSVFGEGGLARIPESPAPPMTPMWFYVALCGDVVPPMLRPTTCGVETYEAGWIGARNFRTPKDCYTAGVEAIKKKYNLKSFGIPRVTRECMWKLVQAILAGVQSPSGFVPSQTDQGRSFFLTLQQICLNEYVSQRINDEFLSYLNNDLLQRNGFVPGDLGFRRADMFGEGEFYGIKTKGTFNQWYEGAATCRDLATDNVMSLRLDVKFQKQFSDFSKLALKPVDGQAFYDQTLNGGDGGWVFDMTALENNQKMPPKSQLIVGKQVANALNDAIKKDQGRFAEGSIPWVSLFAAGGAGFGVWMYARHRARGGKR